MVVLPYGMQAVSLLTFMHMHDMKICEDFWKAAVRSITLIR